MFKVLITTIPFGDKNSLPLEMLEEVNIKYLINPINKKLTEDELIELVDDFDVIIAGTEPITDRVMSNLKMISHVVVGLDSVDLLAA
jgi:D-3-phosphoglycerate dehydrogenase